MYQHDFLNDKYLLSSTFVPGVKCQNVTVGIFVVDPFDGYFSRHDVLICKTRAYK